jgi:hypothetical protein
MAQGAPPIPKPKRPLLLSTDRFAPVPLPTNGYDPSRFEKYTPSPPQGQTPREVMGQLGDIGYSAMNLLGIQPFGPTSPAGYEIMDTAFGNEELWERERDRLAPRYRAVIPKRAEIPDLPVKGALKGAGKVSRRTPSEGGYSDYSMSNRAVGAYEGGRKPLSKITAADLKAADVDIPKDFAVWLAKERKWTPSEWHHTSSRYNPTDFYDPEDLRTLIRDQEIDVDSLYKEFRKAKTAKAAPSAVERVKGKYPVWGGSRSHPRIERWVEFTGEKRGNSIYLDEGGRKSAGGNWIEWGPE